MSNQTVLTDRTVSISEMRKNPTRYFQDGPVAVLSHNRTAGYMVSPELFERMASLLSQTQEASGVTARFKISPERLKEVAQRGFERMENLKPEDIGAFAE